MLNIFKKKPTCPWCDNPLSEKPTIVFVESAEGKYEVEICDECGDLYEELAKDEEDGQPL